MFATLEGWLVIHSLPYSGNRIQRGFSNANESTPHLSSSYTYYIGAVWETSGFLSCTSFVNLHSPSNYHTFI